MEIEGPIIKIRDVVMVRGQKVATVVAAAAFYGVAPAVLMRAVTRNRESFPGKFMFYLTREEMAALPSVRGKINKKFPVFTEGGVAMLSTVLRSPKAVQIHIEIIRQTIRLLKFASN